MHIFRKPPARTRANADYGKPGFTRECGKRFHRGIDIAPLTMTATGRTTKVLFTDCSTGREYESEEPVFVPHDEIFCVCDGLVEAIVSDEAASELGKHVVLGHVWPQSRARFFTVYAHLSEAPGPHPPRWSAGERIGRMGQTSRSADARNWMAIAPHLHFEVCDASGAAYNPLEFLQRVLER